MNLLSFSPHLDFCSSFIRHDRRRLPLRRSPEFRCHFGLENPNDLLAPIFVLAGAAAGPAAYLHRSLHPPAGAAAVALEWILFTIPTPFNRCVLLRCPSVSFENDVNVSVNRGRIPLRDETSLGLEMDLEFQRVCLRTDDGGVISMDWPDYLDLEREQGLDTTVLIVPGTPEGSMDRKVRLLVLDVVKHGCFPIVMNPRGCAGSALTTAR